MKKCNRLAVAFYGGARDAAASYAVLDALHGCGFGISRASAAGMSAVGAMLYLAGVGEADAARYIDGLTGRTLGEGLPGVDAVERLSELAPPLTVVLTELESGRALIFGAERRMRTGSVLFEEDAPLRELIAASACPWITAEPLISRWGALCGIPSAAGIRYAFPGERREGEALMTVVFLPRPEPRFRTGSRVPELMAESMRVLADERNGYSMRLSASGDAESCFRAARCAVEAEKEQLMLYV